MSALHEEIQRAVQDGGMEGHAVVRYVVIAVSAGPDETESFVLFAKGADNSDLAPWESKGLLANALDLLPKGNPPDE